MGCQGVYLALKSFDDELDIFSWDALNGFLDDMVPILVLNTLQNVVL